MSTTYKIQFSKVPLSIKRFANARDDLKQIGAKYDATTKTWTVIVDDEKSTLALCPTCGGTGQPIVNAASRDGKECGGCKQYGAHKHLPQTCDDCSGGGEISRLNTPRELALLRSAEQAYGLLVAQVDDNGRAELVAERAKLLARLKEINDLLGEDE